MINCPGCKEQIPYLEYIEHTKDKCIEINYKNYFENLLKEKSSIENSNRLFENKYNQLFETIKSSGNYNWRGKNYDLKKNDNIFISKFHLHPLKLIEDRVSSVICDICKESISNNNIHSCIRCDFDYCNKCKEWEENCELNNNK